jgi:hypothetical protein
VLAAGKRAAITRTKPKQRREKHMATPEGTEKTKQSQVLTQCPV